MFIFTRLFCTAPIWICPGISSWCSIVVKTMLWPFTADKISWSLINIFQDLRKCLKWPANGTVRVIFSANKGLITGWTYVKSGLGTMYGILDFLNKGTCSMFRNLFRPSLLTIPLYIGTFGPLALKASGWPFFDFSSFRFQY